MSPFRPPKPFVAAVLCSVLVLFCVAPLAAVSNDDPDLQVVTEVRQEEYHHSQVMDILSELTDRIGPRLTGSPNMKMANEWTRDKFTEWGLSNAHLEPFGPFGRGWENEYVSVRMVAPDTTPLLALPKAWTPGTNGITRAEVLKVKLEDKADLDKYKGKLAGKILLIGDMRDVKPHDAPELERYDEKRLTTIAQYGLPPSRYNMDRQQMLQRMRFARELAQFLQDEKVAAVIEPSRGDGGTIFVQGTRAYLKDYPMGVPQLVMAIEHYGRLSRLIDHKVPVELELDIRNKWFDDDPMAYNTVAEIPGTDKKDEIVMLGAHLDSWHAGTGATDNAAGTAVVMEAVRILKAIGVQPRRTIRVGLWAGEEEGLLGSRAYVSEHFASRPQVVQTSGQDQDVPDYMRRQTGPLSFKPEYGKVAAYFNIDNGTGKIRGIYLQENAAVRPTFEKWMEPFNDLGATTITMRNTSGTDHLSFDAVGIPGFQFIQDPVEYMTRTHHSNMDVYERLQKEDLMQAATILAAFVYDAAMRDQMLPRKPLDKELLPADQQRTTKVAEAAPAGKVKKAKKVESDKKGEQKAQKKASGATQ